jgi:hypothetical protein
VTWIKVVVAQHVPVSKAALFFVPWWSSELTQLGRNARRARREHGKWPSTDACRAYLKALSAKGVAIRQAKAACFKQAVADAARGRRGIWPLAKWAKEQSYLPPMPSTFPFLSHYLA